MATDRPASPLARAARALAGAGVLSLLVALPSTARATTVLEDPVGDVFLFGPVPPGAPPLPDLVEISGGYTSTHMVLGARFAPGTLTPDSNGAFFSFALDLDLDERTGRDFVRGAEQLLFLDSALTKATLCSKILVVPAVCSGEFPLEVGNDSLSLEIPLGPDGLDDDGVARFGFVAGFFWGGLPLSEDIAFDVTSATRRDFSVQTSAIVPEPGTGLLLVLAGGGFAATRLRRGHAPAA